jgi:hypothetical protein
MKDNEIYIISTECKPVKIVYERENPCPIIQQYRCQYSELKVEDEGICVKCNNFKNCDKFKCNTFGIYDLK